MLEIKIWLVQKRGKLDYQDYCPRQGQKRTVLFLCCSGISGYNLMTVNGA